MKAKCKNCYWWKNEQSEFNFSKNVGFCHPLKAADSENGIGFTNMSVLSSDKIPQALLFSFRTKTNLQEPMQLVTGKNFGCRNFSNNN